MSSRTMSTHMSKVREAMTCRWPLLLWFLAVGVVWIAFRLLDEGRGDTLVLWLIGGVYAIAVLVMLVGTRRWTPRGLGILGTIAGDVGLYGRTALARMDWLPPLAAWESDLIRALFVVSAPLILLGLGQWVRERAWRRLARRRYGVRGYDRRSGRDRRRK